MGYDIKAEREEKKRQAKRTAARQARIDRMNSMKDRLRIFGLIEKAKELFGNLTEKISQEYAKERERSKSPLCRCKDCGKEISKRAESCPGCGALLRKKKQNSGCGGCLVLCFLVFIFFAGIFGKMLPSFDRKTVVPPAPANTAALPAKPVAPSSPQTANTVNESAYFQGIQYTVIENEKQHIGNVSKCIISIRLEKKVTEEFLRNFALKLRENEHGKYDLFFIFYILPDMEFGRGAWATTHFNPNIEVKILGMTIEEENKLLSRKASHSGEIIGEWVDQGILGGRYTFLKENGKFIMVTDFKDGSKLEKEMLIQRTVSGEIRLDDVKRNDFGEYFVIESDGDLGLYGENGLFRTIHSIK
jgi:hypothetical protein